MSRERRSSTPTERGSLTAPTPSLANQPRYYRARTVGTLQSQPVYSPWSNQCVGTINSNQWWLLDPLNQEPDTAGNPWASAVHRGASTSAITATKNKLHGEHRDRRGGAARRLRPFGRTNPILTVGDMYGEEFDLGLIFLDSTEWNEFNALRLRRTMLCLRSTLGETFYVRLGAAGPRDLYGAASSDARSTQRPHGPLLPPRQRAVDA